MTILAGQDVAENPSYKTSVGGEFNPMDLVPCQRKDEEASGTCAFLALSIQHEGSN